MAVAQSAGQFVSVSGPPQVPSPQQGIPGGTSLQSGGLPPPPPPPPPPPKPVPNVPAKAPIIYGCV